MNIKFLLLLIGIILTVIFVLKYNIESFDTEDNDNTIGNIIGVMYSTTSETPNVYEMKLLGENVIMQDESNLSRKRPYLIELTG